jgi:thiol-disulfide isomerase/thioredoxin
MKKLLIFLICVGWVIPAVNAQTLSKEVADAFKKAGIRVQKPLPIKDFSTPMLNGGSQSLSDFKGKTVFLNFWATWCGPCRLEMPSMEALYQRFKDRDFVMLAVDLQEDRNNVSAFVQKMGLTFPVGIDNGGVSQLYGIEAIPTTYLIKDGVIIASVVGSRNWNTPQVFDAIEILLKN